MPSNRPSASELMLTSSIRRASNGSAGNARKAARSAASSSSVVCRRSDPSRPNSAFLAQILKVDHRIVAYLLGDAPPDERLKHAVHLVAYDPSAPLPEGPVKNTAPERSLRSDVRRW